MQDNILKTAFLYNCMKTVEKSSLNCLYIVGNTP